MLTTCTLIPAFSRDEYWYLDILFYNGTRESIDTLLSPSWNSTDLIDLRFDIDAALSAEFVDLAGWRTSTMVKDGVSYKYTILYSLLDDDERGMTIVVDYE